MTDPVTARGELLELYKMSVEEYRFQAQFNWTRTQAWLVFNTAILAAGIALLKLTPFAAVVFAIGALAAVLSIRAVEVMHGYYRQARDRVRRFETSLDLPVGQRFDTTPGQQGRRSSRINVTAVSYLVLSAVACADVLGVVTAFVISR